MDSIADFESMIEKLSDENQNLKAKITSYQQEISDMEYAQVCKLFFC
jgi:predicted RNase H-like nuclease (RuvC/YqgF family)